MHVNLCSSTKGNEAVVHSIFKNLYSNLRLGSNIHPEFIPELNPMDLYKEQISAFVFLVYIGLSL